MAQRRQVLSGTKEGKTLGVRRGETGESLVSKPLTRVSTPREVSLILRNTFRDLDKPVNSYKHSDLVRSSTQCSFHPTHVKASSAVHSPPPSSQTVSARIQALERSNAALTAQLYAEKAKNVELEIVVKECMEKLAEWQSALGDTGETSRALPVRKSVNLKLRPADKPPSRAMSADIRPSDCPHPLLQLTNSLSLQLHQHQSLLSSLFLSLHHLSAFISRLTQLIHATKAGYLAQFLRSGGDHIKENDIGSVEEGKSRIEKARRELAVIEAQLVDWYADFTANKCAIS